MNAPSPRLIDERPLSQVDRCERLKEAVLNRPGDRALFRGAVRAEDSGRIRAPQGLRTQARWLGSTSNRRGPSDFGAADLVTNAHEIRAGRENSIPLLAAPRLQGFGVLFGELDALEERLDAKPLVSASHLW